MLVGRIEVNLKDLEAVQNLALEADMAAQILESEEGEVVQAVKEGLESALEQLRSDEE